MGTHLEDLCAHFPQCSNPHCQAFLGMDGRRASTVVATAKVSVPRRSNSMKRTYSSSTLSTKSWCRRISPLASTCYPSVGMLNRPLKSGQIVTTSPSLEVTSSCDIMTLLLSQL